MWYQIRTHVSFSWVLVLSSGWRVFHPCWVSLLGCNGYSFICLWSIAPFASLHLCLGSVEAATSNVVNELVYQTQRLYWVRNKEGKWMTPLSTCAKDLGQRRRRVRRTAYAVDWWGGDQPRLRIEDNYIYTMRNYKLMEGQYLWKWIHSRSLAIGKE